MKGIDVSYYQGEIDWPAVKAGGVEFAMIKATQGHLRETDTFCFRDPRWRRNIAEAPAAGLRCGAYHYLTAQTEAEALAEADYFLGELAPYRGSLALWAAVDVEDDGYLGGLDAAALHAVTDAFCGRVAEAGLRPMVYTNPNYLRYHYRTDPPWDLWLALWRDPSIIPREYANMKIWQYGVTRIGGIRGDVDANLGFWEENDMQEEIKTGAAADDSTPAEWAREAVAWATKNGVIFGDEHGNLRLREPCTREAAIVFLYRALRGQP